MFPREVKAPSLESWKRLVRRKMDVALCDLEIELRPLHGVGLVKWMDAREFDPLGVWHFGGRFFLVDGYHRYWIQRLRGATLFCCDVHFLPVGE